MTPVDIYAYYSPNHLINPKRLSQLRATTALVLAIAVAVLRRFLVSPHFCGRLAVIRSVPQTRAMTCVKFVVLGLAVCMSLSGAKTATTPPDLSDGPRHPSDIILDSARDLLIKIFEQRDFFLEQATQWAKKLFLDLLVRIGLIRPPADKVDRRDEVIVPLWGGALRYEDVHFMERIILDTMDVVRAWQRRYSEKDDQRRRGSAGGGGSPPEPESNDIP